MKTIINEIRLPERIFTRSEIEYIVYEWYTKGMCEDIFMFGNIEIDEFINGISEEISDEIMRELEEYEVIEIVSLWYYLILSERDFFDCKRFVNEYGIELFQYLLNKYKTILSKKYFNIVAD